MNTRSVAKELYKEIQKVSDQESFINEFIDYLERKKMEYLLPGLLRILERLVERDRQENSLKITFSREPTSESIEMVKKYMNAESKPEVIVDENILAGFMAEYKGMAVDASAKGYLANLKQQLIS